MRPPVGATLKMTFSMQGFRGKQSDICLEDLTDIEF